MDVCFIIRKTEQDSSMINQWPLVYNAKTELAIVFFIGEFWSLPRFHGFNTQHCSSCVGCILLSHFSWAGFSPQRNLPVYLVNT